MKTKGDVWKGRIREKVGMEKRMEAFEYKSGGEGRA